MEFRITDLMDSLQEVNVDIQPNTAASESRIKELTMKKVRNQGKFASKRRGLGFIGKVLIAAAIIAALAVPVMAASGLLFSDWQEGMLKDQPNDYDSSLNLGSESKKWDVSGWVVEISAENETNIGLTLLCQELVNPDKSGTLTAEGGYWLETWNGSEYVPMEGSAAAGNAQQIVSGETVQWDVNWENTYGKLESGSYRIGKTFTYTNTDGETEEMAFYAKFRIFTEDMAPYLKQYRDAFDALHEKESWHLTYSQWPGRNNDYEYYVTEIWRDGDDYMERVTYYLSDGSIYASHGSLYRDGKGYTLSWKEFDVLSAVTEWTAVDFLDASSFDSWYHFMNVIEANLGEVHVDGNILRFYEYSDFIDETTLTDAEIADIEKDYPTWNHDYTEMAYTFGEGGELVNIQRTKMLSLDLETADPVVDAILEVHDTPAEETARIIASQNVSDPPAFSWTEDQAAYADIGIKEGFRNTSEKHITTAQEAIDRARKEIDLTADPDYREAYEYNVSNAWYDPDEQMWKVVFRDSQDDLFQMIVYLNGDGITQMIVYP